jgi:Helix-turn-helix domain
VNTITTEASRKNAQRKLSADELRQLLSRTQVDQVVDTVDAAALLGITPQTMRRWACYGEGPIKPRRMFGRLRWAVADINAVLNGETEAA